MKRRTIAKIGICISAGCAAMLCGKRAVRLYRYKCELDKELDEYNKELDEVVEHHKYAVDDLVARHKAACEEKCERFKLASDLYIENLSDEEFDEIYELISKLSPEELAEKFKSIMKDDEDDIIFNQTLNEISEAARKSVEMVSSKHRRNIDDITKKHKV